MSAEGIPSLWSPSAHNTKDLLELVERLAELERVYLFQRQREWIEIAKQQGRYQGRKPIETDNPDVVVDRWRAGQVTAVHTIKKLEINKVIFYRCMRYVGVGRNRTSGKTGLESIWEGDSLDWKEIPADEIIQRVVSRVCPGSIVLFHNAAIHTPEALPGVIQYLLQEGYTFVSISQIILPGTCGTDYTIDHTGRQLPCS